MQTFKLVVDMLQLLFNTLVILHGKSFQQFVNSFR